jgi:release factor glutamine methyltransferase
MMRGRAHQRRGLDAAVPRRSSRPTEKAEFVKQTIAVAEAYDRGRVGFMGLELLVGPGTLVPRAETELLGYAALGVLQQMSRKTVRVIDMCCGAGNLACAIAHHAPHTLVWASDQAPRCVEIAARNVRLHGLSDRVSVHRGDLFAPLAGGGLEATIDLIVCNPPYISEKRLTGDRAHLLSLEPREAFAAGPYGLSLHQRVIRDGPAFLRPGGYLMVEVGLGQDRQVELLFARTQAYEDVRVIHDERGDGRVVLGRTIDAPA